MRASTSASLGQLDLRRSGADLGGGQSGTEKAIAAAVSDIAKATTSSAQIPDKARYAGWIHAALRGGLFY
ncbi:hypothetical protein CIT26_30905 [Mesorhizobium temperatum]|uniref:Uncharacterized protein n=1 Tax=Mesorhizobium temperatum TaxID=241416 RepID=A0A271LAT5_9HYPH|nr:hypothetical protein CIT26_30905 [Mesorhizobium temperatum]